MTIDECVLLWMSKKRRMGCVSATDFFCNRVSGFYPKRVDYYTENNEEYSHVIATNGVVDIDLSPYNNKPSE